MKCIGLWAIIHIWFVITDKETGKCKYYARTWSVSILFVLKKNNIATSLLLYMHFIFIVKKKKYHKC